MMKKSIILIFVIFYSIVSCIKKEKTIKSEQVNLDFKLEKIVVINLDEVCLTYFKMKITNPSNSPVILLDNSLKEHFNGTTKPTRTGFYLNKNNKIIPLGINNYYYTKLDPHSSDYYFIGTKDLNYLSDEKDSLLIKKEISNYKIEYNGKKLDLNNLKRSKYIRETVFKNFVKGKETYLAY